MNHSKASLLPGGTTPDPTKKRRMGAAMLWPLVLHCVFSLCIACTMIYLVNNHDFDAKGQSLSTSFIDATKMRYRPSQSDITTIISSTITVLRTIAAVWSGPLYWRSAFLLLEKTGLERQDLKRLLKYALVTPRRRSKSQPLFYVGLVFLGTLPALYAGPILTGSVSWISSTRTAGLVSEATLPVSAVSDSSRWDGYSTYTPRRQYTTLQAVGHITTAWGRDSEVGVLKRVIPSAAGVPVGSIIANVTLPYFSVTSLEWITNPNQTLTPNQLDIYNSVAANLSIVGGGNPLVSDVGALALIQDSPWSASPVPAPSIVSETRILVLYTDWRPNSDPCERNSSMISNNLPPTMGLYQVGRTCFAFAQVTYNAGVGVCANCRVSAPLTVRNDSAISLQEDFMTAEALRMMPDVTASLVLINNSIPTTWGNIDDYVIDVLGRSYSGAWTALTQYLSTSPPLASKFTPSVPSSQAHVALWRVYLWLGIQLMATISGILFLAIQAQTENPLVGDTTLAAFYLDTTAVPRHPSYKDEGLLKLQKGGDRLEVFLE